MRLLSETKTIHLEVKNANETQALIGPHDRHLKRMEEQLGVMLVTTRRRSIGYR